MPSAVIIGKISQPEDDWVLKNFRISIGKEDRVVQAPIEKSDAPPTLIWERVVGQSRGVWHEVLKV
jgi:hypothetical protein